MNVKVELVSGTAHPIETVYHVWEASKTDGPVPSVEEIVRTPALQNKARELFWQVIRQKIPVGEHIGFIFMLSNVSVSFREQMVRHRVGVKVGDRIGTDIVPDLDQSSWWSQSMRIQDMGHFASRMQYRIPKTLDGKKVSHPLATNAKELWHNTMDSIELAYNALVHAGVPMEDARDIIPLGAQHRISWALNLQTLLHVLGKRGCWILQLGLWGPIISGMISELVAKVDSSFQELLVPPCINTKSQFSTCLYPVENQRRLDGQDDHPVCPLFVCRDPAAEKAFQESAVNSNGFFQTPVKHRPQVLVKLGLHRFDELLERAEEYRVLWGHDPYLWDIKAGGA